MNDVVIEMAAVEKRFTVDPPVIGVASIDLKVRRGERVAIVGPSGSGKTTLLQLMGTLERPTQGDVIVAGHAASALPDRSLAALRATFIGFVFQQFHLIPHRSAIDNVSDGLLYRGTPRRERRRAAAAELERLGLGARQEHRPHQLSGGERQRVALARAIVGRPAVVLADEPTGNLDSVNGHQLLQCLRELSDYGTAVVLVTHDMAVAASMDRQITMRDGGIVTDVVS
jgi:putative ABC transport system ATP-binding protein